MEVKMGVIVSLMRQYAQPQLYERALKTAGAELAKVAAQKVRAKYLSEAAMAGSRSSIGQMSAQLGKREGSVTLNPARAPHAPGASLTALSRFVRVSKFSFAGLTGGGPGAKMGSYAVHIDPVGRLRRATKRYPDGIPAGLMAYWLENPTTSTIKETRSMLAYTMVIRRGKRGFGTKPKPGSHPMPAGYPVNAKTIVITPRAHPVWRPAALYTRGYAGHTIMPKIIRKMQQDVIRHALKKPAK